MIKFISELFCGKRHKLPKRELKDIKNSCNILFIDDEKFSIVERLKDKEGWRSTEWKKDIDAISDPAIERAHIVLIDVNGVGRKMGFETQGLGLIKAIKEKYPQKKVVMYSAVTQDAFDEAANMADVRLRKTTDQYGFNSALEKLALEAFGHENCIKHIQSELAKLNIVMSCEQIESKLYNLDGGDLNSIISKRFAIGLNDAAAIANILQLFLSLKV